jgi:hypothetical protein
MSAYRNRVLFALVAAVVVAGGSYLYIQGQVSEAVDGLTVEYSGLRVTGFSLLPFEVNLTLTYTVTNPSGMDLLLSMDGSLLFGETAVTPVHVSRQPVGAGGSSDVEVEVSLTGSILQAVGDYEEGDEYRLEGTLTATHRFAGLVPVTVSRPLS